MIKNPMIGYCTDICLHSGDCVEICPLSMYNVVIMSAQCDAQHSLCPLESILALFACVVECPWGRTRAR